MKKSNLHALSMMDLLEKAFLLFKLVVIPMKSPPEPLVMEKSMS